MEASQKNLGVTAKPTASYVLAAFTYYFFDNVGKVDRVGARDTTDGSLRKATFVLVASPDSKTFESHIQVGIF